MGGLRPPSGGKPHYGGWTFLGGVQACYRGAETPRGGQTPLWGVDLPGGGCYGGAETPRGGQALLWGAGPSWGGPGLSSRGCCRTRPWGAAPARDRGVAPVLAAACAALAPRMHRLSPSLPSPASGRRRRAGEGSPAVPAALPGLGGPLLRQLRVAARGPGARGARQLRSLPREPGEADSHGSSGPLQPWGFCPQSP